MPMKLKLLIPLLLLMVTPGLLRAQRDTKDEITIKNRAFTPNTIHVKKGQAVTWRNKDDLDHTVDAEDGSFSSGTIKSGKTFSHTFKKAGKYPYSCHLHPRMKGVIVVE